ncbi:Transglycosylase SLT domain-containing protein [Tenacibaculum sp. MAR_2009_124]|uniref:lytic transglycosylase domain-containing protein n=1 Tax=Tenacibaculum sp. MAR_2009_124 TaxID=1250059 RepID=UPI000896A7BC|nr:lytic transglycosylase domain-containing protein [Tenacibaculum sp. MAR_2009_124]SEB35061.1 Transglycosylase SLT domain-containing protein [Tenacibaculum sp. MAR_2009_124]
MNKVLRLLPIVAITCAATLLVNTISKENEPTVKNVAENYEIKAVKLPPNMNLAGEKIPIKRQDIRERMDRELLVNTYWQSNGLLLIKRAHKYFPIIEPLLEKYGLPDDFKYLALAESGLMNVKSYAGAAGFWQFLKGTARQYGLEVNNNVDERYHLEKATEIAAKYLKKSKRRFGSWTLAAAAYNAGEGRVSRRLKEQQVSDYFDLLLNEETSRYVFRILALKEIISNPKKYGFVFNQEDLYQPIKSYEVPVDSAITNIPSFAKHFGVTYKELKLANPWLRETKLNNKSRKQYYIKIPANQ